MTKPILTVTEYCALCNILEWSWTILYSEPELCLKDVNYSNSDNYDCVLAGECGLGMREEFQYTLDEPNQENIQLMIKTLMYKLNANHILADGNGNSWETLSCLVDHHEMDRLDTPNDLNTPFQTLENYVLEDVGAKNKRAQWEEFFDNVTDEGIPFSYLNTSDQ